MVGLLPTLLDRLRRSSTPLIIIRAFVISEVTFSSDTSRVRRSVILSNERSYLGGNIGHIYTPRGII